MTAAAPFDRIAATYDGLWSHTAVGLAQRALVAHHCDPLFSPGTRVLDLGCGTGEDALRFITRGVDVLGIDASREMVAQARAKGLCAQQRSIEDLSSLEPGFDGALSNFGPLNCVADLHQVSRDLARLLKPHAPLALVLMNRWCLFEIAHFLRRHQLRQAFRRLNPTVASLGCAVYYPSARDIRRAFRQHFSFCFDAGIGIAVPPSYAPPLSGPMLEARARFDRHISRMPVLRALGDHRLYVFRRRS